MLPFFVISNKTLQLTLASVVFIAHITTQYQVPQRDIYVPLSNTPNPFLWNQICLNQQSIEWTLVGLNMFDLKGSNNTNSDTDTAPKNLSVSKCFSSKNQTKTW